MIRLWDEYGFWILVFLLLTSIHMAQEGIWGIFLAFNATLSLASLGSWLMLCLPLVRIWLPRMSRWVARSVAVFLPVTGFMYFCATDGSRNTIDAGRIALLTGVLAALLCLYLNVLSDVTTRARRP